MAVKVSVIVPVHNGRAWLREALTSVMASRGLPAESLEVVVIDDASTDHSGDLARDVLAAHDAQHTLLHNSTAVGVAAARNQGIAASAGTWLQFLDQDDLLSDDKLSRQLAVAERQPQAAVCYSDWAPLVERDQKWITLERRTCVFSDDPISDLLGAEFFLQIGSCLFRRDFVRAAGGFAAEHVPIDDVHLLQKLALSDARFVRVESPTPVLAWRQHPDSQGRRDRKRFALGCFANAKAVEVKLRDANGLTPRRVRQLHRAYFFCARALAPLDAAMFEEVVACVEALTGSALPPDPGALRTVSSVVGYRRAERLATFYRRVKAAWA